ncbi:MAG: leucyl aminopeptidase [Holosporaceae bacterium]|jgi:leucyl aminopeptidase|nr:leucyl aminopeptidase [Holosporaceae bacterium]
MVLKDISFVESLPKKCSIVVGIYSDGSLSPSAKKVDEALGNAIGSGVEKLAFTGKPLNTRSFLLSSENYGQVVLIGLGDIGKEFSSYELEKLGATIYTEAARLDFTVVVVVNESDIKVAPNQGCASFQGRCEAYIAFGALLKSWHFDKYKSKKDEKIKLSNLSVLSKNTSAAKQCFEKLENLASGIFLTRHVVSEPSNVIYPESLARVAEEELVSLGVEVEILQIEKMRELEMNSLLAVAQGSANEPRLAILQWKGGKNEEAPIAFIGKGVTFDSGGISIKPGDNMHEMRYDMAGAGTVLGLLKAVAKNNLPINVVGVMALVENMPSGAAQRPGDIVKSMSGQTIEVLNTDAEGRMVLADALWYTQNRFNPKIMIDLATLTGAIVVALGHEFAGLFSNCNELAEQIVKSAEETGEKVWRLPMSEHFDEGINSDVADMQNIGKPNIRGGSITAAQFLKRFVNGKRWAHLDIAGVEIASDEKLFICSRGATGFGVHLLYDFLRRTSADECKNC